jgi:hypothetical protein
MACGNGVLGKLESALLIPLPNRYFKEGYSGGGNYMKDKLSGEA